MSLGNDRRLSPPAWPDAASPSSCWRTVHRSRTSNAEPGSPDPTYTNGLSGSRQSAFRDCTTSQGAAGSLFFPPEVAVHVVRLACQRPDDAGQSLSQWQCPDIARQLVNDGIVQSISDETIRRILVQHDLKPWRFHMWMNPHERDQEFYDRISDAIDLYTRPRRDDEMVLCTDEKTSLQPRPRPAATKPALPGGSPNLVEHNYIRQGALNLFSAFDVHTGHVYGQCYHRKRQKEFIAFLTYLEEQIPPAVTTVHIVCDNVSTHHGKQVRQWLQDHPRFRFHFTPVHCSWMNQVEQWFSILQRKRFRVADFQSLDHLRDKIDDFVRQWNERAHPFKWSQKSVAKLMAGAPGAAAA